MANAVEKVWQRGLTWEEVCADPNLDDLPYKIELNEWGQIVMSPTRLKHGAYQAEIARYLAVLLEAGRPITEAAIRTTKGTKVADAAWFSAARWEHVKEEFDSPIAPEICVEILSPRNSTEEIDIKKKLYFDAGAEEVWICDEQGAMHFYTPRAMVTSSRIASGFPNKIEV